jgi:outer membrane murein-binding lipoprotein Lpp
MTWKLVQPHYRLAAALAVLAFALTAAFLAGWTVNGWRIGKAQAAARVDTLSAVIGKIGEDMEKLGEISRGAGEAEARAAQAAEEGFDAIKAYLEATGGGCTLSEPDARLLRDNADRRRAARQN